MISPPFYILNYAVAGQRAHPKTYLWIRRRCQPGLSNLHGPRVRCHRPFQERRRRNGRRVKRQIILWTRINSDGAHDSLSVDKY